MKALLNFYNAGEEEPTWMIVLVPVELAVTTVEVPWPGNAQPVFCASVASGVVPLKRDPSGKSQVG